MDNHQIPSSIDFGDLTTIAIPITNLYGKNYLLKEASADAAIRYRNALQKAATMSSDGKSVKVEGIYDAEPLLVSLCLFETYEHAKEGVKERPVPIHIVRSWPNKVQQKLFDMIKKISELDEDEPEEVMEAKLTVMQKKLDRLRNGRGNEQVKNEQYAMTDTSA